MGNLKLALIGAGGRGNAYSEYALMHPEEVEIVAVADPVEERRKAFGEKYKIPVSQQFINWDTFFASQKTADAVMICTQDLQHYEPAMKAMERGYHVLLEKPMTPDIRQCTALSECAERTGRHLMICHVLRYTNFFRTLKNILDSGKAGKIQSIHLSENIAFWHFSHSYVRGPWRNKEESGPIILTKSCHDMDILYWLAGSACKKVSAFGESLQFSRNNCPKDAPDMCLDGCPHSHECMYYAPNIYVQGDFSWLSTANRSDQNIDKIMQDLKTSQYGRCVYKCDNNVPDHMAVNMLFDNNITATFNLCAYTNECYREIRIMGTHGEVYGNMETECIKVIDFKTRNKEVIELKRSAYGHGGGDEGTMKEFVEVLLYGKDPLTSAEASLHSHVMAFAAEESRLTGKVVDLCRCKAVEWS